KLNHSISNFIREEYSFEILTKLPEKVSGYVIVDVSEPSHIADFVEPEKVVSVFDHHYGFTDYWIEKIREENTHIEMIGACATLIWEEFKKSDFEKEISETSASLLAIAIISNTFNLSVSLTSERDIKAYEELLPLTNLTRDWKEQYFREQ